MRDRLVGSQTSRSFLYVGVVGFGLISLFPYLIMLSTALMSAPEFSRETHWVPSQLDISRAIEVLQEPSTLLYLRNSLWIGLGATVLVLVTGVPAAFVMSRRDFQGRRILLDTVLVFMLFSPVVLIVPIFRLYRAVGLLGSLTGVTIATAAFVLPFSIWLLVGFFRAIPWDIEEAARIDSAGNLRILVSVLMPLIRPGLLAVGTFAFMQGWNEFIFAVTFLPGTPEAQPISVGVFSSVGRFDTDWQRLMILAVLGTVPVLVGFALIQKQLNRGLGSMSH